MKIIINGTGIMFPIIHMIALTGAGNPSAKTPSGIVVLGPPIPGINDSTNIIKHLPRYDDPNIPSRNS
jgi:hypothetical protein